MLDVTTHPYVEGDGMHDDTSGLQELINDATDALHFPTGLYKITDTLHIPDNGSVTGHHFIGSGIGQLGHQEVGWTDESTCGMSHAGNGFER